MIKVSDEYMIATGGEIAATARWSWHGSAEGNGAWIGTRELP
jgi:hypothetical protein